MWSSMSAGDDEDSKYCSDAKKTVGSQLLNRLVSDHDNLLLIFDYLKISN